MQKKYLTLCCVFLLGSMVACAAPPKDLAKIRSQQMSEMRQNVQEITPAELAAMKNSSEKFVLLDIREENERGLTIAAAKEVHLPRGLLEFQAEKSLNENDKIVVYCRTGSRGVYASNQLRALGYRQVYNLKGGITAWMEAGYPVRTFNLGEVTPHNYKQKK